MPTDDGIIHSFQQRRLLDAAVTALVSEPNDAALQVAAQQIVTTHPADAILATLLRHLGTSSSQLRGGLGHLAALLPSEPTAAALRSVAGNRQKSAQERTTAALILERYLHESLPQALIADLAGNEDVPFQSLREAVEESRRNRHILLEYVTQMQEHPVDTAFMVLGLVDRLPTPDAAEMLRLIAQDPRPQVAHAALDRLAVLAALPNDVAALRALHTLRFALKADQAAIVERQLRKLHFGGRRYQPPAATNWRALLSPTDAGGYLSIWLVREPTAADAHDGLLLGFVLSLHGGILQFSAADHMERTFLPAEHTVGSLVTVRINGNHNSVLLEAPYDVGRWLVRQALTIQRPAGQGPAAQGPAGQGAGRQGPVGQSPQGQGPVDQRFGEAPEPLRGEYVLYNDQIWQFEAPVLTPELQSWWDRSESSSLELDPIALAKAAQILVAEPAMSAWVNWAATIWDNVRHNSQTAKDASHPALIGALLRELGRTPDHKVLLNAMNAGLRVQTLWYAIAGEAANAERCALLAVATLRQPIVDNPFLGGLLEAGLRRKPSKAK